MWRGIELVKASQDLLILKHLLWDLKPATIFEIGAYAGGSALWFSDMMKIYGYKTHIYSLDIDLSLVRDLAKKDENITFIGGDVSKIEQAFPEHLLKVSNHNVKFSASGCVLTILFFFIFTYFLHIRFSLQLHYDYILNYIRKNKFISG